MFKTDFLKKRAESFLRDADFAIKEKKIVCSRFSFRTGSSALFEILPF